MPEKDAVQEIADLLSAAFQKAFDHFGPKWVRDTSYEMVQTAAASLGLDPALYYTFCLGDCELRFSRSFAWAIQPSATIKLFKGSDGDFEVDTELSWSSSGRSIATALAAVAAYRETVEKAALATSLLQTVANKANRRISKSKTVTHLNVLDELQNRRRLIETAIQEFYGGWGEWAPKPKLYFTQVQCATEPAWRLNTLRSVSTFKEERDCRAPVARRCVEQALEELGLKRVSPIYYFPERGHVEQEIGGKVVTAPWDPVRMVMLIGTTVVVEPKLKGV